MRINSKVELEIDRDELSRLVELGLEAQGYTVKRGSITVGVTERGARVHPFFGPTPGYASITVTATEAPVDSVHVDPLAAELCTFLKSLAAHTPDRFMVVVTWDRMCFGVSVGPFAQPLRGSCAILRDRVRSLQGFRRIMSELAVALRVEFAVHLPDRRPSVGISPTTALKDAIVIDFGRAPSKKPTEKPAKKPAKKPAARKAKKKTTKKKAGGKGAK